jgi:hypothetical protein
MIKILIGIVILIIIAIVRWYMRPAGSVVNAPIVETRDWEDPLPVETLRELSDSIVDTVNERLNKKTENKMETFTPRMSKLLAFAHKSLFERGMDSNNTMATQYEIILEAGLDNVRDKLIFYPNMGQGPGFGFISEVKLHQEDMFVFDRVGLFLLDTQNLHDIRFKQHAFADPRYFSEEAEIFYNSDLKLRVNDMIIIPGIRTDIFRRGVRWELFSDVIDRYGDFNMRDFEQPVCLYGHHNSFFIIDFPRKSEWVSNPARVRLRLNGLLIRNITIKD